MKSYWMILIIFFYSFNISASEKDQILSIMEKQEVAWNEANLEAFMQPYWKSDKLKFIGKNGIKYGWHTTLENYKKSYPDKAAMGKLHFDVLQVEINNNTAFVLGKWRLIRTEDILSGFYTLFWKRIDGQWLITIDHSS